MKKRKKLLIIDDNKLNQRILTDILEKDNYHILTADNTGYAQKIIKDFKPDLILLDIILPKISGLEFCKYLKSKEKTAEIPVIFISTLKKSRDIVEGFKVGGVDYITKPFREEVVLARIKTHLKLHETKKELKKKNEQQDILLENIDTQIWYLEDKFSYGKVNKSHADFLGYKKEELENKSYTEFLDAKEAKVCIISNEKVFEKKEKIKTEEWLKNSDGEKRLLSITKAPKLDEDGNVEYVVASAEDITERKREEEKIKYLSFHDELTGLYNRRYLENEITRLKHSRHYPLSIIVGDLDKLKFINDNYGHQIGDMYIQKTAEIFKDVFREEDVVARTGGDEFSVILPNTNSEDAFKIINRIKKRFKNLNKKTKKLPKEISISLGSSTVICANEDINQHYINADQKMYENKKRKKSS